MKVLYDHQVFSLQDFGGVSLIYSELLRSFSTMPEEISAKAFSPFTGNKNLHVAQKQLSWHILHKIAHPLRFKLQFHLNKVLSYPILKQGNFDVFHPTYYNPYFLPYLKKPFVVTVYDMAHEVFSDDTAFKSSIREQKKLLAQKADKVIAISQFVKDDLIRIHGIAPEKIDVVHLAGDNILRPENEDQGNFGATLPQQYILYDGTRKAGYKNFKPFLTAITPLLKKDTSLYVVCAGGVPFTQDEKQFFEQLGVADRMRHFPIQGALQMQAVFWKKAKLFAYPSLYEGFGIPLVQSMLLNCPIVGSNTGSTVEIGQDSIFSFDGTNEDSIRATVENALYNEKERQEKISLGAKRALDFTWKKTAEKTLAVYQSLL